MITKPHAFRLFPPFLLLSISFLPAHIVMPHWQIGQAVEHNVATSGGCKLAYQGASYVHNEEFESPLCIVTDGIGASVPFNSGGAAATRLTGLLVQRFKGDKALEKIMPSVIKEAEKERLFAHAGASMVVVTASHDAITVGTVGNARAVLSRGGIAYLLSFDHTPQRPDEHDRLQRTDIQIDHLDTLRVGGLPISRVVGCTARNHGLIGAPEFSTTPLSGHDKFIIAACNGLWSVLSNQRAVALVGDAFARGATPDEAAAILVAAARDGEKGAYGCSRSSITVVVMQCMQRRNAHLSSSLSVMDSARALIELSQRQWFAASIALHPMISALLKVQQYKHRFLSPFPAAVHRVQQGFLDLFLPHVSNDVLMRHYGLAQVEDEVSSWVSDDVDAVNKALASEKSDMFLQKGWHDNARYLAGMLRLPILWRTGGEATFIHTQGAWFDAVRVCDNQFFSYEIPGHEHPLFVLPTKKNDLVFITKADMSVTGFSLLSHVVGLQREAVLASAPYKELVFPMVDYEEINDIKWLKGMSIGEGRIEQAMQQTIFKMNEQADNQPRKKQVDGSDEKNGYIINAPFYCWVCRPGVRQPIFAAYLDTGHWRNPGTIRDEMPVDTGKTVSPLRIA